MSLQITEKFLDKNEYNRPGTNLVSVMAIVMHWTGRADQTYDDVWTYFNKSCVIDKHYSSAHYIINKDGKVYYCVPENEMAYHCGSSQIDPVSKVIYTDKAREIFGKYANLEKYSDSKLVKKSPNQVSIGIEMIPSQADGTFSPETLESAKCLVQMLMKKYTVSVSDVITHNQICGWKSCPKAWVDHPEQFEEFKKSLTA